MAGMTLTLDEMDRFNTCIVKAKALVGMAGAADFSLTADHCLANSMWAITDFLDEANSIINRAFDEGPSENTAAGD